MFQRCTNGFTHLRDTTVHNKTLDRKIRIETSLEPL